jgi:hypothetical protein
MMDDDCNPDGFPMQAGLRNASLNLTNRIPAYSIAGLREAVVVERKYINDQGNRSRVTVMYACRDLISGDIYDGCQRVDMMSGMLNGDDFVLHPTTVALPNEVPSNTGFRYQPAATSDGDYVLLGFIEGSRGRPVILGVLRHGKAAYGATSGDGERRLTRHNGAEVEIDKDGNVRVTPAPGKDVWIGDKGADENLVLGQKFKQFASDLIDALLAATYPTGTGPSGPMLPPQSVTLTNLKAALDTLLSDMAFTQKEKS